MRAGLASQGGVALVITLIMLSVITFLTVAFLAMSRRDRASVTTALNQTDSHLMADTALARFQSEMTARMMAEGTILRYDPLVTRNFINPTGYVARGNSIDTNNVSYVYGNGNPLNNDDQVRNIANLYFDPRPPVFIQTNTDTTFPRDFRFWLDYNRNGRFEETGFLPETNDLNQTTGFTNYYLGEPQWIGVLQNPEYPHSPTNRFIGRYLYFGAPIGKTLDLNFIHNYAKADVNPPRTLIGNGDGFIRNQGVGSWEMNLGAFLHDLNTNIYQVNANTAYEYFPTNSVRNRGDAFVDALSLLSFRYTNTLNSLFTVNQLFPGNGENAFRDDLIDGYSTEPILNPPFWNPIDPDSGLTKQPWSGSRNPQQYFEPQELFDPNKTSQGFVDKLTNISQNNNSYDRYTFQRLLEQMSTGSEPEVFGKININYTNDPTKNVVNTNFVDWSAIQFFTNVAKRLISDNLITNIVSGETKVYIFNTNNPVSTNFAWNNIQVYPRNEYRASVHRLLQLAANIYDATTTNKYPTVFRPRLRSEGVTNSIFEFVAETNSQFVADYFDTSNPFQERANITDPDNLVWGVPVIVGAKKGFPSFNKFMARTFVQVSRKLQLTRPDTNALPNVTNQMVIVGISNVFAMEAWNSYIAPYTNRVRLISTNMTTMVLTNQLGQIIWPGNNQPTNFGLTNRIELPIWLGARSGSNAFIIPFLTNSIFLNDAQFVDNQNPRFSTNISQVLTTGRYPNPTWGLAMTNRLVYALIDITEPGGRVIDFVNLDNLISGVDINRHLMGEEMNSPLGDPSDLEGLWRTNRLGNASSDTVPTHGIRRQIELSMGRMEPNDAIWRAYGSQLSPNSRDEAIANFTVFMGETPLIPGYQNTANPPYKSTQTPFNPIKKLVQTTYWQVNDPLVHYTVEDLTDPKIQTNSVEFLIPPSTPAEPMKLGRISERYRPWGRGFGDLTGPGAGGSGKEEDNDYDFQVKDPRVRWSDDWNFPTNKFPNIGWLGRVHRGTPWQTIYLKAGISPTNAWRNWAGHYESHPTNDWKLMDVFTTAVNDNAARGLLSVNQTNLAAWSAALSGVIVLSNWPSDGIVKGQDTKTNAVALLSTNVQPNSEQLRAIVADINRMRDTNYNGLFKSLGDILSVPSLSMFVTQTNPIVYNSSPFLRVTNSSLQRMYGVDDEAYERIPRQIMSLLKLGEPRFVVYSYGQSLKPAANSLVLNPPNDMYFNLCTNYQITGEVVTRTVLRVDGTAQNPKVVVESYNVLPQ